MKMKKQIEYKKAGDYYLPCFEHDTLNDLGKYVRMRQTYLMNYEYSKYIAMKANKSL